MPTYQYRCTECGHDLEAVQKFTDAALTECPSCRGQLRKVYNAVGVVFKGSGFYRTDSRQAPGKEAADGDSGAAKTGSKEAAGAGAAGKDSGAGSGKSAVKEPATSSPSTSGSGSSTGSKAAGS